MSRFDELIKDLCPFGVEFQPLWKLTSWDKKFTAVDRVKQPRTMKYRYLLAGDLKPLIVNGGTVKLLTTNSSDLWTTEELAGELISEGEVIAIPWGGNPNVQYFHGKFLTADNRIAVVNDGTTLSAKFLYYFLLSNIETIASFYRGAGIMHPSMAHVLDSQIPVPPVQVQREIVRVLDEFTHLEAELEAELTVRRSQRLALAKNFAVSGLTKVAWTSVSLGSITRPSIEPVKVESGEQYANLGVKWYGEGVLVREPRLGSSIKATSLYRARAGQFIYNRMFVVEGSFAIVPERCDGTVVSGEFPLYELDNSRIDPYFVLELFKDEHTLKRIEAEVIGVERGTMKSRRRWKQDQFARFKVLLPPLETQREITQVLRASDALIFALQDEILARRSQYEYYRDKLLTFEKAEV